VYSEPNVTVQTSEYEYVPPIRDILRTFRKRAWVIALVLILCLGASLGFSLVQKPVYESSIKILVGQERKADVPGDLGGEVQGLQQFTQTMTEAVETRPIADGVIKRLGLRTSPEAFLSHLSAEQVAATQFIEVSYRDTNPERAQQIANTTGDVFSEQVSNVSPGANDLTAVVWERATVAKQPVSPDLLRNMLVALVLGLLLGMGLAFLLENMDDTLRTPEEVEKVSGVPNLGVIPKIKTSKNKMPIDKKKGEN
jgi:capsular polysaccharide biosynthesis protein